MSEKKDQPSVAPSTALRATEDKKEKKSTTRVVIKKRFEGIVVGDKMDKTIVVRIDRVKTHPKYKKRYAVSKTYKVHDEKNQFRINDKVVFIECRPLSRDKRWRVLYNNK